MPQEVTLSNPFFLFFFLQTVGFDSPVQLSKGTWTAEDWDKEYFAKKQAENHHSCGCFVAKYSMSESSSVQVPLLNWIKEFNPTIWHSKNASLLGIWLPCFNLYLYVQISF